VSARRIRSANAEFQLLLSLRDNRRQRARQGRFLVEGVRPIDQAVEHGWVVETFLTAADRPLSDWAQGLVERRPAVHVELDPSLLAQLSQKEETSELLAVVQAPRDELGRIRMRPGGIVAVFDRPVAPGNLGSVIRSADAFGADGVVVTGHGADLYDPQTVRASVGSLFALPAVRAGSWAEVERWLERLRGEQAGLRVLGTSARGETAVADTDLSRPLVLVLGNETRGLSWAWRQACDELVTIPMAGSASSLNVAAAAAILLYEAARVRAGSIGAGPEA
jgi:tRNA G18 (ribose-2'-O)-methylase SpoU